MGLQGVEPFVIGKTFFPGKKHIQFCLHVVDVRNEIWIARVSALLKVKREDDQVVDPKRELQNRFGTPTNDREVAVKEVKTLEESNHRIDTILLLLEKPEAAEAMMTSTVVFPCPVVEGTHHADEFVVYVARLLEGNPGKG